MLKDSEFDVDVEVGPPLEREVGCVGSFSWVLEAFVLSLLLLLLLSGLPLALKGLIKIK